MKSIFLIEQEIEEAEISPENFGGKAYHQALAAIEGLPVLKGLVLTTELFPGREWIKDLVEKKEYVQRNAVNQYLKDKDVEILSWLNKLGSKRFSVRSSANIEDLPSGSFAGTFTTMLNKRSDEIPESIFKVWESTFSNRVEKYLKDRDMEKYYNKLRMAVLIQPMVNPLIAGVALSHPLGRPNETIIPVNVVRGLGEKLVSGKVTPQSFSIERGTWAIVEAQDVFDNEIIYEIAPFIGRTIEHLEFHRGLPQDIEFAIDSKYEFILLQNRAIAPSIPIRGDK